MVREDNLIPSETVIAILAIVAAMHLEKPKIIISSNNSSM
jgi:hypothetical protein